MLLVADRAQVTARSQFVEGDTPICIGTRTPTAVPDHKANTNTSYIAGD